MNCLGKDILPKYTGLYILRQISSLLRHITHSVPPIIIVNRSQEALVLRVNPEKPKNTHQLPLEKPQNTIFIQLISIFREFPETWVISN
jgi:hypothetical protein